MHVCVFYVLFSTVNANLRDEEDGGQRISWWNTVKKEKLRLWNTFFILLCVFGVFNDPIFCYMNAIDNEHKCITTDLKMAWFYIWSRTAIDALYLIDMLFIYEWCCGGWRSWKSFLSNLLSTLSRIFVFLPIPQVRTSYLSTHEKPFLPVLLLVCVGKLLLCNKNYSYTLIRF